MRVNNDNDSDYVDDSDNELVFFENGHENSLFFLVVITLLGVGVLAGFCNWVLGFILVGFYSWRCYYYPTFSRSFVMFFFKI